MVRYVSRRLLIAVVTLLIIISATWFMTRFLPGSPFNDATLRPAARANLEAAYGLDQPLLVQYARYLLNVAHGDLGTSFKLDGVSVSHYLLERAPVSMSLGLQAIVIGCVIGVPLGMVAALRHNKFMDNLTTVVAVMGVSVPNFVVAALLQYWVGVRLRVLPIAHWDSYASTVLPSLALSVFVIATTARYLRTEMLGILDEEYVTLLRSKGLTSVGIVVKHVLRNALTPMISVMFPLVVSVVTGSLVIEQIFVIPGIGEALVNAARVNDYPVILGMTILYSTLFVVARLLQDILYGVADPRIRLPGSKE